MINDLGLKVTHDTVTLIIDAVDELKLNVDSIHNSTGHLIDIYGPLVFKVPTEKAIHNIGLGKNQVSIYLRQIAMIKRSLADLEMHIRGYDSVCSLAINELKGIG